MRFSEALLLGIGAVKEERFHYLSDYLPESNGIICGCAIGTAYFAAKGMPNVAITNSKDPRVLTEFPFLSSEVEKGFEGYLWAEKVSGMHCGGVSRECIANLVKPYELAWEASQASQVKQAEQVTNDQPANNREEVSI